MLGYGYHYYIDPTYILVIIGAILSIWASMRVNSTYQKYSRVRSMTGMTGAEAARRILDYNGLTNVRVEHVRGNLTDIMIRLLRCFVCRMRPMLPEAWRLSGWQPMNAGMRCRIRRAICL